MHKVRSFEYLLREMAQREMRTFFPLSQKGFNVGAIYVLGCISTRVGSVSLLDAIKNKMKRLEF